MGSPLGDSLSWEVELDGSHDARFAVSERAWEMGAPGPVTMLPQPTRLSERQSLHTFGLQHRTGALGGSTRSWQPLEAEPKFPMQHLLTQQGMALSDDPPATMSSPRVSWQSLSLDHAGLRLSADVQAEDLRTSPAPLAMSDSVPLGRTCLRSCVNGGASRPLSASHITSPPQPSPGLLSNGRQRGVQSAFRGSPPSLQPMYTEPATDVAARTTGQRGCPVASAACTVSARAEAPAEAAASMRSPGEADHARTETEAFEEYGSFMPAATSPRMASPCAAKPREDTDVPLHVPPPTAHDKRTQTTPRLDLTTSCGTQTS